jgi:hypothetical protein
VGAGNERRRRQERLCIPGDNEDRGVHIQRIDVQPGTAPGTAGGDDKSEQAVAWRGWASGVRDNLLSLSPLLDPLGVYMNTLLGGKDSWVALWFTKRQHHGMGRAVGWDDNGKYEACI